MTLHCGPLNSEPCADRTMTAKDLVTASDTLSRWFASKNITATDSVRVCELFLAMMVVGNSPNLGDSDDKLDGISSAIAKFAAQITVHGGEP
jgi:hypothetical protein